MKENRDNKTIAPAANEYKGLQRIPFLRNAFVRKILLAILTVISLVIFISYYKGDNPHYIALVLFAVTYALLFVTVRDWLYAEDVRYFISIGLVLCLYFGAMKQYLPLRRMLGWQKSTLYIIFGIGIATLLFVLVMTHLSIRAEKKALRELEQKKARQNGDDQTEYDEDGSTEPPDGERDEEAVRLSFAEPTAKVESYSFDDPFYREEFRSTPRQILREVYDKFGEDGVAQSDASVFMLGIFAADGWLGDDVFNVGLGKAVLASVFDYIYSRFGREPSERGNRLGAFTEAVNGAGGMRLRRILASPYAVAKSETENASPVKGVDMLYFHRAYHAFCKMTDALPSEYLLSETYWRRVDLITEGLNGVGIKIGNPVIRKMEKVSAVSLAFSSDEAKCFGDTVSHVLIDRLVTEYPQVVGDYEMGKRVSAVFEQALTGTDADAVSYLKCKIGG